MFPGQEYYSWMTYRITIWWFCFAVKLKKMYRTTLVSGEHLLIAGGPICPKTPG